MWLYTTSLSRHAPQTASTAQAPPAAPVTSSDSAQSIVCRRTLLPGRQAQQAELRHKTNPRVLHNEIHDGWPGYFAHARQA
jgi:hypothetical protein